MRSFFDTFLDELQLSCVCRRLHLLIRNKSCRDRSADTGCCVDYEHRFVLKLYRREALDTQCEIDVKLMADFKFENKERRSEVRKQE